MFIVFDLDGTLRDPEQRVKEHLLCPIQGYPHKRDNVDWDAFFLACDTDTPLDPAIETFKALYNAGHRIEIWTGASDISRKKTVAWLESVGIKVRAPHATEDKMGFMSYPPLIMREQGDHTDDDELKARWIAERGKPDLTFDDRKRVVDMWRNMGVPCFQVAPGDF